MNRSRWMLGSAGAVALLVVSHLGCTPTRSDDVRVALMPQCPVSKGTTETGGGPTELAIAVGELAVGPLVRTAAQLAKAAGQAHSSAPISGATADHYFRTDGRGHLLANAARWGCLVVLVKDLRAGAAASAPQSGADEFGGYRIFLEATIHRSADATALEFRPVTLRYRAAAESSPLGSAARDLNFQISMSRPGAKEPFASALLNFKSLLPGPTQELRIDSLGTEFAKRTGWLPAPTVDASVQRVLQQETAAPGSRTMPNSKAEPPPPPSLQGPTSIQVSIVETREGSVLWKLLGETLEGIVPSVLGDHAPAANP